MPYKFNLYVARFFCAKILTEGGKEVINKKNSLKILSIMMAFCIIFVTVFQDNGFAEVVSQNQKVQTNEDNNSNKDENINYYLTRFSQISSKVKAFTDVNVYIEENGVLKKNPQQISSGLIQDGLKNLELSKGMKFEKAVVRTSDNKEVEIVRVGAIDGGKTTFYSIEDDQDTGIKLKEDEKIILKFKTAYNVTSEITMDGKNEGNVEEYGVVDIPDNVLKGHDLVINIQRKPLKSVTVEYKVGNSNKKSLDLDNGSGTIPASEITGDVQLFVKFTTDKNYTISYTDNSAYMCYDCSHIANKKVGAGENVTLIVYSQAWDTFGINKSKFYLNSVIINDERINVPRDTSISGKEETTLKNGTKVTVKGLGTVSADSHKKDNKTRAKYSITIDGVNENLHINLSSRKDGIYEVAFNGMRGIDQIGILTRNKSFQVINTKKYSVDDGYKPNFRYNNEDIAVYFYKLKQGYNPAKVTAISYSDNEENDIRVDAGNIENITTYYNSKLNNLNDVVSTAEKNDMNYGVSFKTKHNFNSQYVNINAEPYKYQIEYDLDGGEMRATSIPSEKYSYTEKYGMVTEKFYEKQIRTVEDTENVFILKNKPNKYKYNFKGWQLNLNGKIFNPNDSFELRNYLDYATKVEGRESDYIITIKAKWEEIPKSEDQVTYTVEYYKEDLSGDTTVGNKTYLKYYESQKIGTKNHEVISLDEKSPGARYVLNEEESKLFIKKLSEEENKIIYYYDKIVDLTINKKLSGDYANLKKEYEIKISLKKDDKPYNGDISYKGRNVEDGILSFENGKASISLKHDQGIILKDLQTSYSYEIEENTQGYSITYEGSKIGSLDSDKEVTVIGTLNEIALTGIINNSTRFIWICLGVMTMFYIIGKIVRRRIA